MTGKGRRDEADAVSEIVGELLLLFITVAVFAVLVAAVNGLVGHPRTDIVTVGAANNTTAVTLTHMGGDSVKYSDIGVVVNGDAAAYAAAASDVNGNGRWDPGEVICVANPPAGQGLTVLVYDGATAATLAQFRMR